LPFKGIIAKRRCNSQSGSAASSECSDHPTHDPHPPIDAGRRPRYASGMKPLLAAKLESLDQLRYPVLATPKLDGIRCLLWQGRAMTRKLKPIPTATSGKHWKPRQRSTWTAS